MKRVGLFLVENPNQKTQLSGTKLDYEDTKSNPKCNDYCRMCCTALCGGDACGKTRDAD